ncbi:MAG: glycoside hydrolase family 26 protein [Vicinamibacterales bacterium]
MSRTQRLAVSAIALGSAVVLVSLLISLSSATEGPLTAALERLGTTVGSLEHNVRERLSGPGRSRDLAWFDDDRADPMRLRHPGTILLGAYDSGMPASLEGVRGLERAIETTLPLVQIYTAWGDNPEHRFPFRLATSIWNMGSVPVITWEPWLAVFDNARHPSLPLRDARDRHGLAAVARGEYDFYVDQWAIEAVRFGRPLFLRFAHEMNDPYRYPWGPQHNTKEEFIAAWRHVVERFRRAGADNVIWVWSPHVAHEYWNLYYPGADYVDWTATGALNFGPIAQWSEWWSFKDLFDTKYAGLAEFGKPIMIAEFGSLSVGGDRQTWYRAALENLPRTYPAVKALLFFNAVADQTVTYQKVDWSFTDDPALTRTIADAIRDYPRD